MAKGFLTAGCATVKYQRQQTGKKAGKCVFDDKVNEVIDKLESWEPAWYPAEGAAPARQPALLL